jgi:hypothetical protein
LVAWSPVGKLLSTNGIVSSINFLAIFHSLTRYGK